MTDIAHFLSARYRDGARGEGGCYDCWGLTRAARVALYGRPLLPSYGGEYQHNPAGFTEHYECEQRCTPEIKDPTPGAVIAVLRGRICIHVGLVVHDLCGTGARLNVLEINPRVNARVVPLHRFLAEHTHRTIKFHDDLDLPKSPRGGAS